MKVGETLKLSPEEEIDTVVSLDDTAESKLVRELRDYIVTDSLSEYFLNFLNPYNQGRENTGVWLSGFYGSGKSYFAKMLGYLLTNPELRGKSFRDRFEERLYDLSNASLLKMEIEKLDRIKTHAPMLNLATRNQQVRDQGLVRTIYEEFLSHLGYEGADLAIGQMEFELDQNDEYAEFTDIVEEQQGQSWEELKRDKPSTVRRVLQKALVKLNPDQYSADTISDTLEAFGDRYGDLSSSELARQFSKFLEGESGQPRLVVIIDEIGQFVRGKQSGDRLLELQGLAESFKNVGGGKLWLIVTAQEELNTVIDTLEVRTNDVSKISDRFKTKIHLKSEDVQKVLDERIFKKTDPGEEKLGEFYESHAGNISELANLDSRREVKGAKNPDDFVKDYPLLPYHRYELPGVLFSTRSKGRTGGTPRGMIDVTHNLIKNVSDEQIGRVPTIPEIYEGCGDTVGGDTEQSHRLRQANENYEAKGGIKPKEVLQTILFFQEIPGIKRNLTNITRGLIDDITVPLRQKKPQVKQLLEDLEKGKEVIKGEEYAIAGAVDRKLLKELESTYSTKGEINKRLKKEVTDLDFYKDLNKIKLEKHNNYKVTRSYGRGNGSRGEDLRFVIVKPDFSDQEEREKTVKDIENESARQRSGAPVYLVPKYESELENTVEELLNREKVANEHRGTSDNEMKKALKEWTKQIENTYQPELEKTLRKAFANGTLVVKGQSEDLNGSSYKSKLKEALQKRAKELYSERLEVTSPSTAELKKLLRAAPEKRAGVPVGDEFQFFGSEGKFQEGGKVTSEILDKCEGRATGKELEEYFQAPPYGWDLNAVRYGVAGLFLGDKLLVKHEGTRYHSGQAGETLNLFTKTNSFRDAQYFQPSGGTLTPVEKENAVNKLEEMPYEPHEVSSHINSYQLADKINDYVKTQLEKEKSIANTLSSHGIDTAKLSKIQVQLEDLIATGKSENPDELVKKFLNQAEELEENLGYLKETDIFRTEELEVYSEKRQFVNKVRDELEKNPDLFDDSESNIEGKVERFETTFTEDPVSNKSVLVDTQDEVWDEYHSVIKPLHEKRNEKYRELVQEAENAKEELDKDEISNSRELIQELDGKKRQFNKKICNDLELSKNTGQCSNCHSSLGEIKSDISAVTSERENVKAIKDKAKYKDRVKEVTTEIELSPEMNSEEFLQELREAQEEIELQKRKAEEVNVKIKLIE